MIKWLSIFLNLLLVVAYFRADIKAFQYERAYEFSRYHNEEILRTVGKAPFNSAYVCRPARR